jgi:shikimate dehydrogenase
LFGTNTDALGALNAIESKMRVNGKMMLVLGAGGAARAIAYEAKRRGASVFLANRTEHKAKRLASELGVSFIDNAKLGTQRFDIIANATSLGMMPHVNISPLPKSMLKKRVVFDAVYTPPMTKLLRDAKSVGAEVIPGMEMYVNQAALQSALYVGKKPSIELMKKILSIS